jgi:hypothetical protein
MPELKDLGWVNAGGETCKTIDKAVAICMSLGHADNGVEDHIGFCGMDNRICCVKCGYIYHTDTEE